VAQAFGYLTRVGWLTSWVVVPPILPSGEDGILGLGWLNSMRGNIEFKNG
jgi:hypothetical protein